MRVFAYPLILLALLALPQPTTVAQDQPALKGIKACNQALKLLQEGKPAEALEVMTAAKGTLDPEDDWLWWGNTGHCYRDLRKDADALTHYEKAVQLEPRCWFRFSYCLLLHEYGRWDEAVKELDKEIDPDYADYVASLKEVIAGPFKERWPLTWKKLEYRSKRGNYLVVSDVGTTADEMDKLEAEASRLDLTKKPDQGRLEKMLKPHEDLVSLANLAELARTEFIKFCGVGSKDLPKGKISKVFFFMNEGDYHNFAARCGGGDTTNALGFFSPGMKFLQLYSQPGAETRVCGLAQDTIDTFFHEGWHQFFDQLSEQRPIWLNEGLAEFVGHASVKEKGAKIELGLLIRARGKTYTRYEINRELVKQKAYIPFVDFFKFSRRDWNANDSDVCYSQAWSIAYFALKGNDANFKKDYASLFRELLRGRPGNEVVDEIFGDKKLKQYEDSWVKYWLNI